MTEQPRRTIAFGGVEIEVQADPTLDPHVFELRNAEGRVLSHHRLDTLAADPVTQAYVAKMVTAGGATPYAAPLGVATTTAVEPSRYPPDVVIRAGRVMRPDLATGPMGVPAAPASDVVAELRRRVEEETSRFVTSAASATLDQVLDEALRDAVTVGSGFLRIDWVGLGNPEAPDVGDWTVTRLDPTTVEIREES
jgi:hypothetical protein